jgi:hypothetical protein
MNFTLEYENDIFYSNSNYFQSLLVIKPFYHFWKRKKLNLK